MNQVQPHSLFTDFDIDLFKAGKHFKLYEKLGAHLTEIDGIKGVYFAVWAPSARTVSVVGDFNYWVQGNHSLNVRWDGSGIWEGFIPNIDKGTRYKYKIQSNLICLAIPCGATFDGIFLGGLTVFFGKLRPFLRYIPSNDICILLYLVVTSRCRRNIHLVTILYLHNT